MEITTRPRSRRWQRLAGRLSLLAAAMTLLVLLPASLGLSHHVVGDDAMGGTMSRGALAFERPVRTVDELRPGDVITFPVPEAAPGAMVTRRVVAVEGGSVTTRGDARSADDPWALDVEGAQPTRAVFVVPFAGYPELLVPGLSWTVLALLVALTAAAFVVLARRQASRDHVTVTGLSEQPTPAT